MNKSKIEKRLPEPQPNSEPKADELPSALLLPNPMLCVRQSPRTPELIFARKMYLCVQLLGGRSDILSVIGSWRDSLSDEHVFEALDSWIDDTVKEQSDSLDYIKEWHNK